ncbi:MAG: hypothetical protein AAGA72_18620 [Pseudomonadota bacterium]
MSAIVAAELPFEWHKSIPEDAKDSLRQKFPTWFKDDGEPKGSWELGNLILESGELEFATDRGVPVTLKRFKGAIPAKLIEGAVPDETRPGVATVHVHLPNNVLHSFNEVHFEEDACTDAIQELLDEGWRIICVCPPLNSRRPDYILGRNGAAQ